MRASAQVGPAALVVELDVLALRDRIDQLDAAQLLPMLDAEATRARARLAAQRDDLPGADLDGVKYGIDFMKKAKSEGKPFFVWLNTSRMHLYTRLNDKWRYAAEKDTSEADLHGSGRVLLRASGTEPLVRVMVEAADEGTAQSWAERIARVVEAELKL